MIAGIHSSTGPCTAIDAGQSPWQSRVLNGAGRRVVVREKHAAQEAGTG
jgi:hypothetical protein